MLRPNNVHVMTYYQQVPSTALLYLSVSTRAVIGKFSGPYSSPVQRVTDFATLCYSWNCVSKHTNDSRVSLNNDFKLTRFAFKVTVKPFRVNRNRSRTRQTHSRDTINIILASFSRSVLYVTDPCFPLSIYSLCASFLLAEALFLVFADWRNCFLF